MALPEVSNACHLAAADMYIEYAGRKVNICDPIPDYTYEVTLIVYSSCGCSSNTGANTTMSYESKNGATGVLQLPMTTDVSDTVDDLCPIFSGQNQCLTANADLPAYKRRIYKGTVTLPSAQTDWKFWWSSNARNASENLLNANTQNLYIEAGMDVTVRYDNSTPRFAGNPLPYICVNQPFRYLNDPRDRDEDKWDSTSLRVTTTIPLINQNGGTVTHNTANGYSPTRPIDGYVLDSKTGIADFFPVKIGSYTVSFKLEDLSSYVLRDVQFSVVKCRTRPPHIDSVAQDVENATLVPVQKSEEDKRIDSVVFACPKSEVKFNIRAWSEADTNNLWIRADLAKFPGAVFNTVGDGTDRVTGTFIWTPTVNDYGRKNLLVTCVDSTCVQDQPIVLPSYAIIPIQVVAGLDAGEDQLICELNPQPIQLFVTGTEHLRLKWTMINGGPVVGFKGPDLTIHNPKILYPFINDNGDTTFYPKNEGYIISTVDLAGSCKAIDTVFVNLDTTNTVRITPKNPINEDDALVICRPTYLQLESMMKGRRPMDNVACGIPLEPVPTACSEERAKPDTTVFYGSPLFGETFYDSTDDQTPTIMNTHVQTCKKQFLITKQELWAWGLRSSSISSLGFEMTGFVDKLGNLTNFNYNNFTISFKCTDAKEVTRAKGFDNFNQTTVYYEPVQNLTDGFYYFDFPKAYNWDTTKNLLVTICYSASTPLVCDTLNALPRIKYSATSYPSAISIIPGTATDPSVCGVGQSAGVIESYSRPVFTFASCEVLAKPFDIVWKEGQLLSDSTSKFPLSYAAESDRYVVEIVGRSKCIMRDTLEVYIPEHDIKIQPADTALCFGDKAPVTITGGYTYKWYEYKDGNYVPPAGVDNPFNMGYTTVGPDKTTDYRIVVSDSVFCYDTIAARVEILPLPDVKILNIDDTVIKYGQSFSILATGARFYNWSPVSSLNNPNVSYPIARPTEDTKYIVGGIGANGCRAFDTLHVIVDKRDDLFVPSAFSPNGDGKNDLFRVTNLSFQRIMEFRVFNRWGQEVYSTNDSRAGWDGTWGGVPQDMGTYTYLIRVAYPDGFVETYKGETTLIR